MKRWWLGGGVLFLLLGLNLPVPAQGPRFEEVVKDMLGTMEKLTGVLGTIKDEDTAKAAKPDLRQIAGRWQELRKKAETMKPPSKEEKERLEKEYKEKLQTAQRKLFAEIARVNGVAGGKDALQEISTILKKGKKES